MRIKPARSADAAGVGAVLEELVLANKRTKRSDPEFARTHYVEHPDRIECVVAEGEDGAVLGFQSLKLAREGNAYGTPARWGIIGTHIRPSAARRGVGTRLFTATREAARTVGLTTIEAYIGARNSEAQAYYEAMGFRTYRHANGAVVKAYEVR